MLKSEPATTETPQADRHDACVYRRHHRTGNLCPQPGGKEDTTCRQRTQQTGGTLHVIHIPSISDGQDLIVTQEK